MDTAGSWGWGTHTHTHTHTHVHTMTCDICTFADWIQCTMYTQARTWAVWRILLTEERLKENCIHSVCVAYTVHTYCRCHIMLHHSPCTDLWKLLRPSRSPKTNNVPKGEIYMMMNCFTIKFSIFSWFMLLFATFKSEIKWWLLIKERQPNRLHINPYSGTSLNLFWILICWYSSINFCRLFISSIL